jgi:hypothetical protein
MAITQISKIQIRRGLNENLPILSEGELGWSIDTQQLWIGNGTLADGAPLLGNTQILTQYSNLFQLAENYTYQGSSVGYIVQTGPTTSQPIQRSLQAKLDDFVNVKDFGATGNGTTNDLAAINRALYQLYCRFPSNVAARKKLYFPAGTYLISGGIVEIPTNANLVGDGKGRSMILQTDNTQTAVAALADSAQQIGASIGNNGATPPSNIKISGITFQTQFDQQIMTVAQSQNIIFQEVGFIGPFSFSTTPGNSNKCVYFTSTTTTNCLNIRFEDCRFSGLAYPMSGDNDMQNIVVTNSYFYNLYGGPVWGQYTTGTPPSATGPFSIRFANNTFDKIATQGLLVYNITNVSSEFNYYGDVGNNYLGLGNPAYPVIQFGGKDCYSISDAFQRNDADNGTQQRVLLNETLSFYLISHFGLQYGQLRQAAGNQQTLLNNTSVATATGIQLFTTQAYSYFIDYSVYRGTSCRTGTIVVSMTSSGQTYQDSGLEATGTATGVTFSLSALSNSALTINYTTTNTGTNATLIYAVRRLTTFS